MLTSEGLLQCAYHGWAFDGGGACRNIPQLPAGPSPPPAPLGCPPGYQHDAAMNVPLHLEGQRTLRLHRAMITVSQTWSNASGASFSDAPRAFTSSMWLPPHTVRAMEAHEFTSAKFDHLQRAGS